MDIRSRVDGRRGETSGETAEGVRGGWVRGRKHKGVMDTHEGRVGKDVQGCTYKGIDSGSHRVLEGAPSAP